MDDTSQVTPETKPKVIRRRQKRGPRKPTRQDLSSMPLPLGGPEAPREEMPQDIPRLSHWVCRDDEVFWTRPDHGGCLYRKGDVLTVDFADHEQPHRFDFARGFWYPAGAKVVDLNTMRCIPQQFEPFHPDGKRETIELWKRLLVDPRKINFARANVRVGHGPISEDSVAGVRAKPADPFIFKTETEDRITEIESLGVPEPIDPKSLLVPDAPPEKFNPADLAAKGGFH